MRNGVIGIREDVDFANLGFYLYNISVGGVFPDSQITMIDGTVHNIDANVSSLSQRVVVYNRNVELSQEDVVMLKRGDTLLYRIEGEYHQVLKTAGEISLCVVKFLSHEDPILKYLEEKGSPRASPDWLNDVINSIKKEEIDIKYEYREQLYLVSNGKRHLPTDKNFSRSFDSRKDDVKNYLKENKKALSKNADIVKFFEYLSGE